MELKEFVKETLIQISAGVQESIEMVRDTGGYTNPAVSDSVKNGDTSHFSSMGEGQNIFLVDFDVAITVDESADASGGAKLKVAGIFSAGGDAGISSKSSSTNRVSFKIPLALPVDPTSRAEIIERRKKDWRKINN
jgi:hypothetical protein